MPDGGNTNDPSNDGVKNEDQFNGLNIWNIGDLQTDFDFLNMPDDNNFSVYPTTINTPGNTGSLFAPTPPATGTTTGQTADNSKKDGPLRPGPQDYLVNHYENILGQSKVSMKEAISPGTQNNYRSPGATGASPPVTMNNQQTNPQLQQRLSQQRTKQLQQHQSGSEPASRQNSITTGCDHCRRRQIKCVMVPNLTHCIQCESKGLKCTFSDSINNPKLKRNMGVINDEPSKRPRVASSPQAWMQQQPQQQQSVNLFANQSTQQQSLQQLPQQGQVQGQFRRPAPTLQYPRSSFFVGTSSMFDSSLLDRIRLDKIDQVQLNRSLSLRKVSPDVQFILRDDFTEDLALSAERSVDQVESMVSPHGPALIQIYFRIIHPSFPILHKKVFLEKYARSYREFSAPLLASVYSIAAQWWDEDPNLAAHPKPDVDALNDIGLKSFFEVTQRPRLSAVQAGLLLLQGRSDNPNNWILCQQVVSLAEELGLGLDCHDWKLPKWERGLRRRLAWAVWIQEKWTALTESRVSHLTLGRNWLVRNISNEDFPEVPTKRPNMHEDEYRKLMSEFEVAKNLFQEQIQLSLIVSEIMDTFYTYAAQKTVTRIDQVLKLAKPLQLKLRQWYHSLPQNLQMASTIPDKVSPIGCLHLSYFAAEITLHRKIILNLTNDVPPELTKVCRAAATTRLTAVLDFVKNLKKEQLGAFWHSSSASNFSIVGTFASILYVTSQSQEEATMFKEHVNTYRSVLQQLGRMFNPARQASMRIDMLLLQVPGLIRDFIPSTNNTPTIASEAPFSASHSPQSSMHMMSPFLAQQMNMNPPASQNMPNNQPPTKPAMIRSQSGLPVTTTTSTGGGSNKNSPENSMLNRSPRQERMTPASAHDSASNRNSPVERRLNGTESNKNTPKEVK